MLLSQQKKIRSIRPEASICRAPGLSMYCVKRRAKRWRNPARSDSAMNAKRPHAKGRLHALSMSGRPSAARHPAFPPRSSHHLPHSRPAWRQPMPHLSPPRSRRLPLPASQTTNPTTFPPARPSSTNQPARQVRAAPALPLHDRCAQRRGVHREIGPNRRCCPYPAHDDSATTVRLDARLRVHAAAALRRYAGPAAGARRLVADNGCLDVASLSASRGPAHRVRFCPTS